MKVSVVIPAYNEEKYIGRCLKSLQEQTIKPYEVIVVDNNSKDKTAEIAKRYGARVLFEPQQGQSYARNTGFNDANGEIIARTDADTIVPKDWVEKIEEYFKKHRSVAAISGPAVIGSRILSPVLRLLVFRANKRIFGHIGLYGPNLAIRKDVWERIKKEVCMGDSRIHEDLDLAIHAGKIGLIKYASDLKVKTSARRIRFKPSSLLVDYLIKWGDTIASHKKYRVSRITSRIKQSIS